ncbi:MAG TPA: aminoglycoside phosphotransferase family protein [Steroidobacteraceae bacterium]|nr:aminoglycoside phosphotransferase family protein [Steroidobacteraceae bacterium]
MPQKSAPVFHHSKPAADIGIDEALVRSLLCEQHPDLASLPLREIDSGWDNAMFRLGDSLVVRLPRRVAVTHLIEREQEWLPQLAPLLPIPVPAPVRLGRPAQNYSWRWSIVPWLAGRNADLCEPRADQAERLAAFLCALHRPAPANAPLNPYRGVPLREREQQMAERVRRLERETTLLSDDVMRIYHAAIDVPIDVAPTWLHGDLHAGNLLVEDGTISGVIDWGDMTVGDRATDLATLWMNLNDRKARENAMRACNGVSDATWLRAKGWAVFFGVTLGTSGLAGDKRHALMARRTLERIVAGP